MSDEEVCSGRTGHAEAHHRQYLAKNPWGYCGLAGTGVGCPRHSGPTP